MMAAKCEKKITVKESRHAIHTHTYTHTYTLRYDFSGDLRLDMLK